MELLGFSGPRGILGSSEPLPGLLSLPVALHNEPEAGKRLLWTSWGSLRFLNHGEPWVCPSLSTLFFWASLGRQLCGPRQAGLLLCRGSNSCKANGSHSLRGLSFLAAKAKAGKTTRYIVLIFWEKEIGQLTRRENNFLYAFNYRFIQPLFIEQLQFSRHHVRYWVQGEHQRWQI